MALAASVPANGLQTVGYLTGPPPCTTKEAEQPPPGAPRAKITATGDSWMQQAAPTRELGAFPHGQTIDDFAPTFFSWFPPGSAQAYQTSSAPKVTPALPVAPGDAKVALFVSTCQT